jgi:hypothetical protein
VIVRNSANRVQSTVAVGDRQSARNRSSLLVDYFEFDVRLVEPGLQWRGVQMNRTNSNVVGRGRPSGAGLNAENILAVAQRPSRDRVRGYQEALIDNKLAQRLAVDDHSPRLLHVVLPEAQRLFTFVGLRGKAGFKVVACGGLWELGPLARLAAAKMNLLRLNLAAETA